MGTDQIMYCIVALILGMLLANMLKSVCGCKVVEGFSSVTDCLNGEPKGGSVWCAECEYYANQEPFLYDVFWLPNC
jgi:hypothetical protein